MSEITWILESEVFPNSHASLRKAIKTAGNKLLEWDDLWWTSGIPGGINQSNVIFHGSLGNAHRIQNELDWRPGSFCNTSAFCCSAWYDSYREWLVHKAWKILPADELIANKGLLAKELGCQDRVFIRPDSPLKPFSGRVLDIDAISLRSLDHGFYFDDVTLPVVIAPVREIGKEWRFVVVDSKIISGSAYEAETRSAKTILPSEEAWSFAAGIAKVAIQPDRVYVLDVCESESSLHLLELNPFGGADLYACNVEDIVTAISDLVYKH